MPTVRFDKFWTLLTAKEHDYKKVSKKMVNKRKVVRNSNNSRGFQEISRNPRFKEFKGPEIKSNSYLRFPVYSPFSRFSQELRHGAL